VTSQQRPPLNLRADDDRAFLRLRDRPAYGTADQRLRLVDLFCGCGALSLGIAEGARRLGIGVDVRLAVDDDPRATAVYGDNFPGANVKTAKIETLFDGALGDAPTRLECSLRREIGDVDALIAGPPCQGHSSLNNHTRSDDPRNTLYGRVVRAAEVFAPQLIIVENVPGVERDKRAAIPAAVEHLKGLGYVVEHQPVSVDQLGVPQRRRRHLLVAASQFSPTDAFHSLLHADPIARDVRWAIEDLRTVYEPEGFDGASQLSADNERRAQWLIDQDEHDLPNPHRPPCHQDGGHSYKSMYGRLYWDRPAQTVTTGFGSPGQGRYIHPEFPRTITPHEAARLQTIPDFFSFAAVQHRGSWARMIGNAVPPLLGVKLAGALLPRLNLASLRRERALMEAA
jgi:DNA (cytosine-5)-methyltransferase 1